MPLPKVPQNVTAIRSEDRQSMLVSWDAVTEDVDGDPGEVTAYKVHASELANGLRFEEAAAVTHNVHASRQYVVLNQVVVAGGPVDMDPDMLYFFKVAAVNYEGTGEFSPQETDF